MMTFAKLKIEFKNKNVTLYTRLLSGLLTSKQQPVLDMQSPSSGKSADNAFPQDCDRADPHQPTNILVPCTPPRPKPRRRLSLKPEAKLQCRHCTKTFSSPSGLRYHVAAEHIHEHPHRCSFEGCGRKFVNRSDRDVHERYHRQEKPHRCRVGSCAKRFVTSRDRLAHEATHSGARPYVCTECQKGFKTSSALDAHKMVHEEHRRYACQWPGCNKRFKFSTSLRVHTQTHSGQRPWKCPDCNKSFTLKGNMRYHQNNSCSQRGSAPPTQPTTLKLTFGE